MHLLSDMGGHHLVRVPRLAPPTGGARRAEVLVRVALLQDVAYQHQSGTAVNMARKLTSQAKCGQDTGELRHHSMSMCNASLGVEAEGKHTLAQSHRKSIRKIVTEPGEC